MSCVEVQDLSFLNHPIDLTRNLDAAKAHRMSSMLQNEPANQRYLCRGWVEPVEVMGDCQMTKTCMIGYVDIKMVGLSFAVPPLSLGDQSLIPTWMELAVHIHGFATKYNCRPSFLNATLGLVLATSPRVTYPGPTQSRPFDLLSRSTQPSCRMNNAKE